MSDKNIKTIHIAVSEAEYKAAGTYAKKIGLSRTAWCRSIVKQKINEKIEKFAELRKIEKEVTGETHIDEKDFSAPPKEEAPIVMPPRKHRVIR